MPNEWLFVWRVVKDFSLKIKRAESDITVMHCDPGVMSQSGFTNSEACSYPRDIADLMKPIAGDVNGGSVSPFDRKIRIRIIKNLSKNSGRDAVNISEEYF